MGNTATLPSARRRKALGAHGGGEGRGRTVAADRLQLVPSGANANLVETSAVLVSGFVNKLCGRSPQYAPAPAC